MKQFQFQKIREYREAAGLTQFQLAGRLGVFVQQVTAWENSGGDKGLTTGNLAKIADALNKNTDDFFIDEGKGDNRQNPQIPELTDMSSGQ